MKIIVITFWAFVILLTEESCRSKEKSIIQPTPNYIFIDSSVTLQKEIDSAILKIEFIPLQAPNDVIIGNIQKVAILDNKIIILNKNGQNSISIFNFNGLLFKVIKSPEDDHISDFIIQNHKILIFLDLKQRVEIFSNLGVHLETKLLNKDLLASSFEYLDDQTYAFWNNTSLLKIGNYRLLLFDSYNQFKKGFLPFAFELSKNGNPFNQSPFYNLLNGYIYVSQPLDDTIWSLTTQNDNAFLYPNYILKFQKKPLPPAFLNNIHNYNMFKIANDNNYSYYLKGFMDFESIISFSYVSGNSHYIYIFQKNSKRSIANTENLRLKSLDIDLPGNMVQISNNSAVGYYHSYDLTKWAESHKNSKDTSNLLSICKHLSDIDDPVLILITYK